MRRERLSVPSQASELQRKALFSLVTSWFCSIRFRIFDFGALARVRGAMLVRERIVLTTVLILILPCPFLHGGVFTFWSIVLHAAHSSVTWGDKTRLRAAVRM